MTEPHETIDPHLLQLIFSLQAGAMQQMGKVASPFTGKIERNLDMARHSIDMIDMLNTKMAGNLTKEESEILKHALYELRLNYVDEVKKEKTEKAEGEPSEKVAEPSGSQAEPGQTDADQESSGPEPSDGKSR